MRFESRINDILLKTAIHESMDRTYNSLLSGRPRVDIGDVIVTESRSRGLYSYTSQTINETIFQNIRDAANALFGRNLSDQQLQRAIRDPETRAKIERQLTARTYRKSNRQGKLDMIAKYVRNQFSQQILSKAQELMSKFNGDNQIQRDTRRAINKLYGTVANSIKSWTPQLKELAARPTAEPAPAAPTAETPAAETPAAETAAAETAAEPASAEAAKAKMKSRSKKSSTSPNDQYTL